MNDDVVDAIRDSLQTVHEGIKILLSLKNRDRDFIKSELEWLINKFGFSELKNEFDTVVHHKAYLKSKVAHDIEGYLLSWIADTFSSIILDGAKGQADEIQRLFAEVKKDAEHYAEGKNLTSEEAFERATWEKSFREEQKKIAQEELKKHVALLAPKGYNSSVFTLQLAKDERVRQIETMPVSEVYCANKIMVKKFLKETPSHPSALTMMASRVAAQQARVVDYILSDLLFRKTPEECLTNFKRYVQVADKLLHEGHADAATVIITALNNPVVARLEIEDRLSSSEQKKINSVKSLIDPEKNHKAYRDYLAHNPQEYLAPALIQKTLLFGLEGTLRGDVFKSSAIVEAETNCRHVIVLYERRNKCLGISPTLKAEMKSERVNLQTHYENSWRRKPRGDAHHPNPLPRDGNDVTPDKRKRNRFYSFFHKRETLPSSLNEKQKVRSVSFRT